MQRWSSSVGDGKQKRKVEPALKRTTPAKRRPPPLGRELGGGDFYWEGLGKVQELRPQLNLLPLPPPPLLPPYLATAWYDPHMMDVFSFLFCQNSNLVPMHERCMPTSPKVPSASQTSSRARWI